LYKCPYCERDDFPEFNDQRAHITAVHPGMDLNVCAACNRRYSKRSNLVTHMKRHTDQVEYACTDCGRLYSSKNSLAFHMKTHAGQGFSCIECGRKFLRMDHLVRHERTHTGERPYSCHQCSDSFAHQSTLKDHMLTHTGERPHACPQCDKRFSLPQNLKSHMRTHTGEKRFTCTLCNKHYAYQVTLTIHMRTHHPCLHDFDKAVTSTLKAPGNRFPDFAEAQSDVSAPFREADPVPAYDRCPHCGVDVLDLETHIEVCPWRQGPSWQ